MKLRTVRELKKRTTSLISLIMMALPVSAMAGLFGYQENERENLELFPQWLSVLERNIKQNAPEGDCKSRELNQCHVKKWISYLNEIKNHEAIRQLKEVNDFANKQPYILDIENYGIEDYWATPAEFLYNHGDCEDYAIIKMLSLKMLGFKMNNMKLVVLQDTNLRIPHAVLAVETINDTLILDNQIDEVISHKFILHYVPIYAINEARWWMFLPE